MQQLNHTQKQILKSFRNRRFLIIDVRALIPLSKEKILLELDYLVKNNFLKTQIIQLRNRTITRYSVNNKPNEK